MRTWYSAQFVTIVITYNDYWTVHCIDRVCFYQVHHHVHWAGFDGVNSMHKLLDLFKGRSVGRVMRATSPNQLRKHRWVKRAEQPRWNIQSSRIIQRRKHNLNKTSTSSSIHDHNCKEHLTAVSYRHPSPSQNINLTVLQKSKSLVSGESKFSV